MTENLRRARQIAEVNAGGPAAFRALAHRTRLEMIADALDEMRGRN